MALTGHKAWARTSAGSIVAGAAVEVRRASDSSLATLYTDAGGGTGIANPFAAESTGDYEFYAEPDRYNVLVGAGASQVTVPVDLTDGRAQVPFEDRSAFVAWVAGGGSAADGTIKSAGGISWMALSGSTDIADLPGWVPFGDPYADHWASNTSPGVTDMTSAIQAAIDYSGTFSIGSRPTARLKSVTYLVSDTIRGRRSQTILAGEGSSNTRITRSGDFGDTIQWFATDPTTSRLSDVGITGIYIEQTENMTNGAHLHMSDIIRPRVDDVQCWDGFVGMRLRGMQNGIFESIEVKAGSHWTTPPVGSRFVVIEDAQNPSNETSALFFSDFNFERTGNAANETKVERGVEVLAADGVWFDNGHIFGATSDVYIEPQTSTSQIQGLRFTGVWFDQWCDYHVYITGTTSGGFGSFDFDGCKGLNAEVTSIYCDSVSLRGININGAGRWSADASASWLFDFVRGDNFKVTGQDLTTSQSQAGLTGGIQVGSDVEGVTIQNNIIGTSSTALPVGISIVSFAPDEMVISGNLFQNVTTEIQLSNNLAGSQKISGNSTNRANWHDTDGDPTLSPSTIADLVVLTGSPSNVEEIFYGWEGRTLMLRSDTSAMTYVHNGAVSDNKIFTSTGGNIVIPAGGYAIATYDPDAGAWYLRQ